MYVFAIDGRRLQIETAPGVFSADGPDDGTQLLIETALGRVSPHMRVLDLGCGAGILGLSLAASLTRGEVWLGDVDVRAVRVTERNIQRNRINNAHAVLSDGTLDLPPKLKFDLIVSNPPTHDGKDVLRLLVEQSYKALRPGGSLLVVVNRLLSTRDMMASEFGGVGMIARRKGFQILASEKARRSEGHSPESD